MSLSRVFGISSKRGSATGSAAVVAVFGVVGGLSPQAAASNAAAARIGE
jgi:hypothetical protein